MIHYNNQQQQQQQTRRPPNNVNRPTTATTTPPPSATHNHYLPLIQLEQQQHQRQLNLHARCVVACVHSDNASECARTLRRTHAHTITNSHNRARSNTHGRVEQGRHGDFDVKSFRRAHPRTYAQVGRDAVIDILEVGHLLRSQVCRCAGVERAVTWNAEGCEHCSQDASILFTCIEQRKQF